MKITLTGLLVLLSFHSFAQMRVEAIETDKDMGRFLDEYYYKDAKPATNICYGYHPAPDYKKYVDSACAGTHTKGGCAVLSYIEERNKRKWIKADLNKDGQLDLVVVADLVDSLASTTRILAFISQKDHSYSCIDLSTRANEDAPCFIDYDKAKEWLMIGVGDDNTLYDSDTLYTLKQRIRIDTLSYQYGMFLDYNIGQVPAKKVDTLLFTYNAGGWPTRDNWTMMIPGSGNLQYTVREPREFGDTVLDVVDLYELNSAAVSDFWSIVQKLPLAHYKDKYRPIYQCCYDGAQKLTAISFADGSKKNIYDLFETGPSGLLYIYAYIEKLRKSDQWKFVKTIAK